MSPAISKLSSALSSRTSDFAASLHNVNLHSVNLDNINLPSHQRVFSLTADTLSKLNIPDIDQVNFETILSSDLGVQGIVDDIREYFKGVAEDIKKNTEEIVERIKAISWDDKESIKDGLSAILDYMKPVFQYVKDHPWILIPLLIPAFELFLALLGFGVDGVVMDSIAAILQSRIGNVPKKSLFAFFQSVGAKGWAFDALQRTNMMITIAILIIAGGQYLIESGVIDLDEINRALEGTWNRAVQRFDPPPSESIAIRQITPVLNLSTGWVKYGVWASVIIPIFACAGEGL